MKCDYRTFPGITQKCVVCHKLPCPQLSWFVPYLDDHGKDRTTLNIVRRIGASPVERGSVGGQACPDIFELEDGSFAVIGTDKTELLDGSLPADASRADYEKIVVITRETLLRAKKDIPDV